MLSFFWIATADDAAHRFDGLNHRVTGEAGAMTAKAITALLDPLW